MNDIIYRLAKRLRPDLESMSGQQRMSSTADVLTLLYSVPLAVIGLIWLVRVSDWASVRSNWQLYLLMAGILYIFNRLRFFFITEIRSGGYANSDGAMDGIAVWAAILLLGPTALWLKVIWNLVIVIKSIQRERTAQVYWSRARMFTADVASDSLTTLVALMVYQWAGGSIPIRDFSLSSILPALLAVFVQYIGTFMIYVGYIAYVIWSLRNVLHSPSRAVISFFFMAITLPALANPFGILAAGIYASQGLWEFLYIILGLLLVAMLARRLSHAAEFSRQQSRQLEQLEKLGRAILDEAPDASTLPAVLRKHVSTMFASRGILIWTESRGILLQEPATMAFDQPQAWEWLQAHPDAYISIPRGDIPWNHVISYLDPIVLCPIKDEESSRLIGHIFLELQTLTIPWDMPTIRRQLPALQSLGAQIASALRRAKNYEDTLTMQKTMQELSLARTIQDSFLPESVPKLQGWQLTATLEPARQIAGDYYDFIHLPENRLGILIADVADKGLGSALYMALSSTLIRTFASEYYLDPAKVLQTVNQQILRNARANLFVTIFYGVLDPSTGVLNYANAGHNPPYLIGTDNGVKTLNNTGMPLGIDEENSWGQDQVVISPGEMLLMYTDGVTDAQNIDGEFIDRKLLLSTAQQQIGDSVEDVMQGILDKVHRFVGDSPRFDDITLVILRRENEQK
jgi:serine phosphatase RsbU (regulator of sigma subunit)